MLYSNRKILFGFLSFHHSLTQLHGGSMMKRKLAVALAIFAIGVAPLSLLAQMAPPGPLDDDLYNWMIGEW
jgi:hypothetical protein